MTTTSIWTQAALKRQAAIREMPCLQCGADAGEPCREPKGTTAGIPHFQRREAAIAAGKYRP